MEIVGTANSFNVLANTLSSYAWEQREVNAIASFGEAGKAVINNIPYVLMEPCQSPTI